MHMHECVCVCVRARVKMIHMHVRMHIHAREQLPFDCQALQTQVTQAKKITCFQCHVSLLCIFPKFHVSPVPRMDR